MTQPLTTRLLVIMILAACGCRPQNVEVRCVAIHYYGESPAKGSAFNEQFTFMTVERLDTRERRNFPVILGQTNEVFVMNWSQRHYE